VDYPGSRYCPEWQSGLKIGVFCFDSVFPDRPEWGVFGHVFPDFCGLGLKLGIIGIKGRKTGLFKPVWERDRFSEGLVVEEEKGNFEDLEFP
jgi:hypothetical protein